ncbi:hypothetical protein H4R22_003934, partial [Coemansia sp. RSA 1290]
GMPCSRKAKTYAEDQVEHRVKLDDDGKPTSEVEEVVTHKKGEIINGFCAIHKKLAEKVEKMDRDAQVKFVYEGEAPIVKKSTKTIKQKNKSLLPVLKYETNPDDGDVANTIMNMSEMLQQLQKTMNVLVNRQNGMRDRLDRIDPKHNEERDEKINANLELSNQERIKEGKTPHTVMSKDEALNAAFDFKIQKAKGQLKTEGGKIGDAIKEKHPEFEPKPDPNKVAMKRHEERLLEIKDEMARGNLLKNQMLLKDDHVVDGLESVVNLITDDEVEKDKKNRADSNPNDLALNTQLYKTRDKETLTGLLDNMVTIKEIDSVDVDVMKKIMFDSKSDKIRNPIRNPKSDVLQKSFLHRLVVKHEGRNYTYEEMWDIYDTCFYALQSLRYDYEDGKLTPEQAREYKILVDIMREEVLWINSYIGVRPKGMYHMSILVERMMDATFIFESKFKVNKTCVLYDYKFNGCTRPIEEFTLDEVVYRGGSGEEEIVTESVVIRGPFTIHARDFTGGNGENLAPPNNYTIVKIPGKNNDCLIDCFNYFCRESRDPRLVREAIGCNHDRALAPKWIPKLEEYFKINVCVVEDYHNRTNEYFSYGKDCDHKILYHGKHYSVVKDKLPTIEVDEHEDEKLDTFYYFFDYETVYDPYTYKLEPYSWAMVKYNNKREKIQEWFCTFDEEELARLLFLEANKHEKDNLILVGYNNSRFDNFFLLNLALKYELNIFKTLFVNNTILGMNIEGFN